MSRVIYYSSHFMSGRDLRWFPKIQPPFCMHNHLNTEDDSACKRHLLVVAAYVRMVGCTNGGLVDIPFKIWPRKTNFWLHDFPRVLMSCLHWTVTILQLPEQENK